MKDKKPSKPKLRKENHFKPTITDEGKDTNISMGPRVTPKGNNEVILDTPKVQADVKMISVQLVTKKGTEELNDLLSTGYEVLTANHRRENNTVEIVLLKK